MQNFRKKLFGSKLRIVITTIVSTLGLTLLVAFNNNDFKILKNLDIYYSLFKEISLYYVDDTDPEKLVRTSIEAMLASLDPYTVFIPESDLDNYKFITSGEYGGIGTTIRKNGNTLIITDPYEGYPAQKAGLKAGDIVHEINGKPLTGITKGDISELLKGEPKSTVELTIERPGDSTSLKINVTREKITIRNVPYFGMIKPTIGYIKLIGFTEDAHSEVKNAITKLKEQGAKSIILDLRGNPGGLLAEAVDIVNLFVDKGQIIVTTKGKAKQWNASYPTKSQPIDKNIPLVVMVNQNSASASEIVAGSLQDLDRGVIIGQRTFGKGLVQTTRPLSYNTKLKVTTAKYYIPSGRCIQALDYSHREANGKVSHIPDSLIQSFKTKNGRKVYDGGGILPDIEFKTNPLSKIAYNLYSRNFIFDFATLYACNHASICPLTNFKITNQDYTDFAKFIKEKKFNYLTESEQILEKLKSAASKEKYMDGAKAEFDILSQKLAHDKSQDLEKNKEEITTLLEEEIVSRYYYQSGRIQVSIKNDPMADKAVQILKDKKRYTDILKGRVTTYVAKNK